MTITPGTDAPDVDLGSLDFWGRPAEERDVLLRVAAPRGADLAPPAAGGHPRAAATQGRPDYWAIVRYDDIRRISRDPATFCSGQGVQFGDAPPELLEASQSFLAMDAPRHTKLRGLVSAAFTPRQVARIEDGHPRQRQADRRGGRADRRRRLRRADRQAAAAA